MFQEVCFMNIFHEHIMNTEQTSEICQTHMFKQNKENMKVTFKVTSYKFQKHLLYFVKKHLNKRFKRIRPRDFSTLCWIYQFLLEL